MSMTIEERAKLAIEILCSQPNQKQYNAIIELFTQACAEAVKEALAHSVSEEIPKYFQKGYDEGYEKGREEGIKIGMKRQSWETTESILRREYEKGYSDAREEAELCVEHGKLLAAYLSKKNPDAWEQGALEVWERLVKIRAMKMPNDNK